MSETNFKKGLVLGIILLFVGTAILPTAISYSNQKKSVSTTLRIWYVDDDRVEYPTADFTDIQEAIDNASVLDTDSIWVYKGEYNRANVHKRLQITGGFNGTSIIDGGNDSNVVSITNENVKIERFTIMHSGDEQKDERPYDREAGIHITAKNARIKNNTIIDNKGNGIFSNADDTEITGNIIMNNALDGIGIYEHDDKSYTTGTFIEYNKIKDNGKDGVYCFRNKLPKIHNNCITGNGKGGGSETMAGIKLHRTQGGGDFDYTTVKSNWITNNTGCGIIIKIFCIKIVIRYNNISGNSEDGISFEERSMFGQIQKNDFMINKRNAYTMKCPVQSWTQNYWSDYDGSGDYNIRGRWLGIFPALLDWDTDPHTDPWNYPCPVAP